GWTRAATAGCRFPRRSTRSGARSRPSCSTSRSTRSPGHAGTRRAGDERERHPEARIAVNERKLRTRTLVGVAMLVAAWTLASHWPDSLPREFWFWLLACLAGELMWVPLPLGRGSTASMASCFNFAALLVLRPGEAL